MRCDQCGCTLFSCQCNDGPRNTLLEEPKRMWYAHITENRDYPPRERPGVLHLTDLTREGATNVTEASDFKAFLAAHPEIGTVTVYDSRFPQRPVVIEVFMEKHARKIWPAS